MSPLMWELLGAVALVPEVGRSLPQTWRVLNGGRTAGVSGAAALMTTATGAAWTGWSLQSTLWSAAASSGLFTLGFALLAWALARRRAMRWSDLGLGCSWIVTLVAAAFAGVLDAVLVTAVVVQNIPAVVAVARSRDADGVSLWSAAMGATEGALWGAYGVGMGAVPLALYGAAQLTAQGTVGLLAARRRRRASAPEPLDAPLAGPLAA